MTEATVVAGMLLASLVGVGLPAALGRLPEPASGEGKTPYAELATPRFCLATAAAVAAGFLLLAWAVPEAQQLLWWPLASVGTVLAAVDLATTWLPRVWTWAAVVATVVCGAGAIAAAGLPAGMAIRGLIGGAVAFGVYLCVFVLGRGQMGFGDVRYALLVGVPVTAGGWSAWFVAMMAAPLLALVPALAARSRGHAGIPFAPALLAGAYLAAALS